MLWHTLAAVASSATPVPSIVADFEKFCGPQGKSTQAILAQADRAGWKTNAAGAPRNFDPATERFKDSDQGLLKLAVATTQSAGEQRQVCGVSSASAVPGIAAATQTALGFKPALDMGTSATFFAVSTGNSWQSGAELTSSEFAAAKAAGRYYSIVASTTESSSMIYALHVLPSNSP
jgi:hypothetical protein